LFIGWPVDEINIGLAFPNRSVQRCGADRRAVLKNVAKVLKMEALQLFSKKCDKMDRCEVVFSSFATIR